MTRPAVLLVTPFSRQPRGNSVTFQRLYNGLCARGIDMDMACMDDESCWSHLQSLVKNRSYDMLHVLHAGTLTPLLKLFPQLNDLPILLTTTGTDVHVDLNSPVGEGIAAAIERADRIVVFNSTFIPMIASLNSAYQNKTVVVPQGVDLPSNQARSRSSLKLTEDDVLLIMPSGLRPVKRIEFALDAVETAVRQNPHLKFLLIGPVLDQDYSVRILQRIETLPWAAYWGSIPHDQISSLLALGDVVLNTSLVEGQPQAALEAMSLGIPAVISAVPGNLGIFTDGQEGYYAETPTQLAAAVLKLSRDHVLRRQMGTAAARLVSERYSAVREIDCYERLYWSLIYR